MSRKTIWQRALGEKVFERNIESYERHQERVVAQCGLKYGEFVKFSGLFPETSFFKIKCRSNYCPDCRKDNIKKLRSYLYDSICRRKIQWRFITLTYDNKKINQAEQFKTCSKTWEKLYRRLSKRYDGLSFVRTFEVQSCGSIHAHIIVNKYIPINYLIEAWSELGGGAVDIQGSSPVCKVHKRKACSECYPSQWNYKNKCNLHNVEECRTCYEFLNECRTHRVEKCGTCYPSNVFDVNKYAVEYLTDELVKTKKHQDVYKLGLLWWLLGRRTIATSRDIKLNKKDSRSEWAFNSMIGDVESVKRSIRFYVQDSTKRVGLVNGLLVVGSGVPENFNLEKLDSYYNKNKT